jgi:hypothetical protein
MGTKISVTAQKHRDRIGHPAAMCAMSLDGDIICVKGLRRRCPRPLYLAVSAAVPIFLDLARLY